MANESELLDLEARLKSLGVLFVSVREISPPYNNQLMAIGIVPQVRSKSLRKALARYALVR